jgi:hypothetical protein
VLGKSKFSVARVVVPIVKLIDTGSRLKPTTSEEGIDDLHIDPEDACRLDIVFCNRGPVDLMRARENIEIGEGLNKMETASAKKGEIFILKIFDDNLMLSVDFFVAPLVAMSEPAVLSNDFGGCEIKDQKFGFTDITLTTVGQSRVRDEVLAEWYTKGASVFCELFAFTPVV